MISLVLHSRSSCDFELSKCLNSQTWQTGWTTKIMCRRWKFDQKPKNWTWLHMMRFSFRIKKKHVSFDTEMYFMRFGWKWVFCNPWWKSVSHGIQWKKFFWSDEKNALCLRNKWEVLVFILRKKFLTQQTLMEWKILKAEAKSSLRLKISSKTLTLGLLSLSPKLNGEN